MLTLLFLRLLLLLQDWCSLSVRNIQQKGRESGDFLSNLGTVVSASSDHRNKYKCDLPFSLELCMEAKEPDLALDVGTSPSLSLIL